MLFIEVMNGHSKFLKFIGNLLFCLEFEHVVEFLVQNGADINTVENTGNTALILAAYKGKVQIIFYENKTFQ